MKPEPIGVETATAAIVGAARLRDIWACVGGYLRARGARRFAYQHFPPPGAPDAGAVRVATEGFPDDFARRYVAERLYRVDPIILRLRRSVDPLLLSDLQRFNQISAEEQEYLDRLGRENLGDGLGLQVFGPSGRNGFCAVGFAADARPVSPLDVREIQWVSQLAHLRYCAIVATRLPQPPVLTARETEVLAWVARGKSNPVIAEIIGVSPHTVDAHLRRIYLKLGVADRINAAIRGLGVGLVDVDG
jgi:DNA-binding CsgD family transcriptional regulator